MTSSDRTARVNHEQLQMATWVIMPVASRRVRNVLLMWSHLPIRKGVRIGHDSVIAAGSVVTHDIPPGVIAAGNPAQAIRGLQSQ